jgi:hypothetical protein
MSPDDFSITEHICHLRDLEKEGYLVRIRKILAEDHPQLPDFDGGRIAEERDYNRQDAVHALREFTAAREETIEILGLLRATQWEKTGNLSGVGSVNLKELAQLMIKHDETHLQELEDLTRGF